MKTAKLEHGYVYKGFASSLHCIQGGLDEWAQFPGGMAAKRAGFNNEKMLANRLLQCYRIKSMNTFIEQLLNGIAVGAIYALITLGLALVYGVLRVLHVAHAAVYTAGAYIGLFAYKATGSILVATVAAMALCGVLGVLMERAVYSPLLKYPPYVPLISSIAMFLGFQELFRIAAGPYIIAFNARLPLGDLFIGQVRISAPILIIYVTSALTLAALWLLLYRTEIGLAIRATSQDRSIASTMGMHARNLVSLTFFIGSAVAAIAGILVGIHYNQVYPTMGTVPAYKSLALIVVGGLGSLPGAVFASLLLGVLETLLIGYANVPLPRDSLAFIAMIAVLLWRPQGLFGRKGGR